MTERGQDIAQGAEQAGPHALQTRQWRKEQGGGPVAI